jgi:tRNA-dihydrouridine synthase
MSEKLNFKKDIVPMPDLETLEKEISQIKNWKQSFSIEDGRWLTEFRKHLFSYVKWIDQSKEFKVATNTIKDYQALVAHIENFF